MDRSAVSRIISEIAVQRQGLKARRAELADIPSRLPTAISRQGPPSRDPEMSAPARGSHRELASYLHGGGVRIHTLSADRFRAGGQRRICRAKAL